MVTKNDFNELVQQLSRKLYGHAYRILLKQEEAEDAVQEVFIRLWKMKEKLNVYESIEALAITITKNYCIDQFRKQKKIYQEIPDEKFYSHLTSPSPHEQMEISESNEIIYRIIDQLPELFKVMIRLKEIEGLTYEEIAEKTDQNINTLRVTLSRARRLIREEYNKYHYERKGIKTVNREVL